MVTIPPRSAIDVARRVLEQHRSVRAEPQFCDSGDQYRSAIFYRDAEQQRLAEAKPASKCKTVQSAHRHADRPGHDFYPAEDYHQDYYLKNPIRYKYYRFNCGRDQRLEQLWGTADK